MNGRPNLPQSSDESTTDILASLRRKLSTRQESTLPSLSLGPAITPNDVQHMYCIPTISNQQQGIPTGENDDMSNNVPTSLANFSEPAYMYVHSTCSPSSAAGCSLREFNHLSIGTPNSQVNMKEYESMETNSFYGFPTSCTTVPRTTPIITGITTNNEITQNFVPLSPTPIHPDSTILGVNTRMSSNETIVQCDHPGPLPPPPIPNDGVYGTLNQSSQSTHYNSGRSVSSSVRSHLSQIITMRNQRASTDATISLGSWTEGTSSFDNSQRALKPPIHPHLYRKRKHDLPTESDIEGGDSGTCSSSRYLDSLIPHDDSYKRQNHSEIEKRRRDKMNHYITQLSSMVPMCRALSRKLDKLTVLRMTVQHMRTLKGSSPHSCLDGRYKPSFITDDELKKLLVTCSDGFLFVVECDRGRLLHVSESVFNVLHYTQGDLLGQSWLDILHPKDVAKVKEQLSSADLAPRERLIDAKTMRPVKGSMSQEANGFCSGARRSFFCRMKCKSIASLPHLKEETRKGCLGSKRITTEKTYAVVHCTGYLKPWTKECGIGMPHESEELLIEDDNEDTCNLACLVAVGRVIPVIASMPVSQTAPTITFISKHSTDGKFTFIEQTATMIVGFLSQEMLGTSMYEYFHPEEMSALVNLHKRTLRSSLPVYTGAYRFRTRSNSYIKLNSYWTSFANPWTHEIEFIISKTTFDRNFDRQPPGHCGTGSSLINAESFDANPCSFFIRNEESGIGGTVPGNRNIQPLISTQVPYYGQIGQRIANVVQKTEPRALNWQTESDCRMKPPRNVQQPHSTTLVCPPPLNVVQQFLDLDTQSYTSVQAREAGSNVDEVSDILKSKLNALEFNDNNEDSSINICEQQEDFNRSLMELSPTIGNLNETSNDPLASTEDQHNEQNPVPMSPTDEILDLMGDPGILDPQIPALLNSTSNESNDEAAMAVIMTLLEADAGLGGSVDFTGLPWPIP